MGERLERDAMGAGRPGMTPDTRAGRDVRDLDKVTAQRRQKLVRPQCV